MEWWLGEEKGEEKEEELLVELFGEGWKRDESIEIECGRAIGCILPTDTTSGRKTGLIVFEIVLLLLLVFAVVGRIVEEGKSQLVMLLRKRIKDSVWGEGLGL